MRLYKILTRTLLILSIINFALAAPVAVQERHEVRLDVGVTRAAPSQKRWNDGPGGSTIMPGPDRASPQSLDSTDSSQEAPTSPTGSVGSNSESTPVGSPGPSSHPPPSSHPSPNLSGSSEDRSQDPLGLSLKPNTFQLKGSTSNNPVPLVPTDFRDKLPVGSMPVAGSLLPPPQSLLPKPNLPGSDHPPPPSLRPTATGSLKRPLPPPFRLSPSRPGPSRDRPPSFSVTPDNARPQSPDPSTELSLRIGPPTPSMDSTDLSQRIGPPPSAPPNPALDGTDLLQRVQMMLTGLRPLPSALNMDSTGWPQRVPPSAGSQTGSRLLVPMAGSLSLPPPPSPHPSQPGSSEDRFPDPLGLSLNPNTFESKGSTSSNPTPPQSLGVGPETHSPPPNARPFPTELWDGDLKEWLSLVPIFADASSRPSPPPPLPHPSQPEPSASWDRLSSPSGTSAYPDTLLATGPAGNQPTLELPGPSPETHSPVNPEPLLAEFWNNLVNGKIKPRMSGSDAVDLAQEGTQGHKF